MLWFAVVLASVLLALVLASVIVLLALALALVTVSLALVLILVTPPAPLPRVPGVMRLESAQFVPGVVLFTSSLRF